MLTFFLLAGRGGGLWTGGGFVAGRGAATCVAATEGLVSGRSDSPPAAAALGRGGSGEIADATGGEAGIGGSSGKGTGETTGLTMRVVTVAAGTDFDAIEPPTIS